MYNSGAILLRAYCLNNLLEATCFFIFFIFFKMAHNKVFRICCNSIIVIVVIGIVGISVINFVGISIGISVDNFNGISIVIFVVVPTTLFRLHLYRMELDLAW